MSLRWRTKKILRRAVAWTALGRASQERSDRGDRGRVLARVLTFHRFADRPRDPFAVAPERFAEQVASLAAEGIAVSLEAFERALAGQMTLPPGAVLITIDDGAASTLAIAAPILARHRVPAVAFVTPGLFGAPASGDRPERTLRADEVRALAAFGIDVGAHGWSHRSLGRLGPDALALELGGARRALEDLLGHKVGSFAYPFGTARDHSAATRRAAVEAGYRLGFTSEHGATRAGDDPLVLPRVKIEGGEPLSMFHASCAGGLDAWRLIDRHAWWLQARPGRRTEALP